MKSTHNPDDVRRIFGAYWNAVERGELLYMPIVQFCWGKHTKASRNLPLWLGNEPRKASMYEVCADKAEHVAAFGKVLAAEGSPRLWVNTLTDALSAGHADARALLDPDGNWGWVLSQGATMIQTDMAAELILYLIRKGRRHF